MADQSHNVTAQLQHGIGCLQQGRLEEAWNAFNAVVVADARNALAWHLMGLILLQAGQGAEGIDLLRRAIALDPRDAVAHSNLANALWQSGAYGEALASAEQALARDPNLPDAHLNRGNALLDLGRPAEALAEYDAVIARQPTRGQAHSNRGNALRALNRNAEAAASFARAMELEPANAEIRVNGGFAHLALGDYARGLELFEHRWKSAVLVAYLQGRNFGKPFWRGEASLGGKTILLHAEQGFGDTLQFCRYAALVKATGARVSLEVEPALAALMTSLTGVDRVVTLGEPLPPYDFHCPLMSLPFALGTTLETIPAEVPYLWADPERSAAWRERLGPKTRPRVGLVWSSGVRPDQPELKSINGRRNLALPMLAAFRGLDVEFHSLQKGQPAEAEFEALDQAAWDGPPIVHTAKHLRDFADTAAVIDNLDLLVTVDTSVAHLAGALGKPVWIMNRFDACWRWSPEGPDSLWYPTARLFRQRVSGDWSSVLDEVRAALAQRFDA